MLDKALLIGINYVGTSSELRGCINDVVNMRDYLEHSEGVKSGQMKILTEVAGRTDRPTKANILAGIRWLVEGATAESRLFIHYSGHGSYVRDRNGDESDHRDETLCPLDYQSSGLIIDDQLRKIMVDPLPSGCKLWALFDCCHSGTALDLRFNYRVAYRKERKEYTIVTEPKQPKSAADVYLFSGCLDHQTSADAYEERQSQGAMTYGLLRAIRELQKQKKPLSYKKIMKRLLILLKGKGYTQTPQLSTGKFIDLGNELWK